MSHRLLPYSEARAVADHLRAQAEVRAARPTGLVLLLLLALASRLFPEQTGPAWFALLAAALLLGPLALARLLPPGTPFTYRLALLAPLLNTGLLATIGHLETSKLAVPELESLPTLHLLVRGLALFLPAAYLAASLPWWLRRWRHRHEVLASLAAEPPQALGALQPALDRLLRPGGAPAADTASFRTVPPRPGDLRRFLKPDFTRHGLWHVLLAPEWALVVAADGTRAEAVPRGGLKLVTDETPAPHMLCLIRWNQHLHEGRIAREDAALLLDWITQRPVASE